MNYPVWELDIGGGLLIAAFAVTHSFVAHVAVGGSLFLALTERRAARTGDAQLLAWLRSQSRLFALVTLVVGSTSGVGLWLSIGAVSPAATSSLLRVFLWVWAVEAVLFAVTAAAALVYQGSWDRLDPDSHLGVARLYAAASLLSLVGMNGLLSFMYTPGAWLETRSLGDAFFNPTFWPSLLVRLLGAAALGGLFAYATAWRAEPELRPRLVRRAARWTLPALAALPLAAWLYFRAGPSALAAVGGEVPRAAYALRMTVSAAVLCAVLAASVALLARRSPAAVSLPTGLALLGLGYLVLAGGEYIHESLRKPFVIGNPSGGYLYVDGLTRAEAEVTRRRGLLSRARWATGVGQPAENVDDRARGADLFRIACRGCHTVTGYNGIRRLVDGRSVAAIDATLRSLDHQRGRMAPFPGDDEERAVLARYLAGLDGLVEPGRPAKAAGR